MRRAPIFLMFPGLLLLLWPPGPFHPAHDFHPPGLLNGLALGALAGGMALILHAVLRAPLGRAPSRAVLLFLPMLGLFPDLGPWTTLSPLYTQGVLIAFLLLLAGERLFPEHRRGVNAGVFFLVLTSTTLRFLHSTREFWVRELLAEASPPPVRLGLWIALALACLSLRKPWRPGIRLIARGYALVFMTGLTLLSLFTPVLNALRTNVEVEAAPFPARPLPRYRPAPNSDPLDTVPESLRSTPESSRAMIRFIRNRQSTLHEENLLSVFNNAPHPPEEMFRQMRIHGLLPRDRLGFHASPETFQTDLTHTLRPEYLPWVEAFRDHLSVRGEEVDENLFQEAVRQRVLIRVAPGDPRFRFSAHFRGPLENGLTTRQILTVMEHADIPEWSVESYGKFWQVDPLDTAAEELAVLADRGFLKAVAFSTSSLGEFSIRFGKGETGIGWRVGLTLIGITLLLPLAITRSKTRPFIVGLWMWTLWHLFTLYLFALIQFGPASQATLTLMLAPTRLLLLFALLNIIQRLREAPWSAEPSGSALKGRDVRLIF